VNFGASGVAGGGGSFDLIGIGNAATLFSTSIQTAVAGYNTGAGFVSVSTAQEFPPAPMTTNTTAISGQAYGNGTYIASASDVFDSNYQAFKAFNKSSATAFDRWNSSGSGTFTTTNITGGSGSTATGSWLQLQVPVGGIIMRSYSLHQPEPGVVMTAWLMLGSTDGTNWVQLDSETGQTFGTTPRIYNITNNTSYTRYRLVSQGGSATMYEWRLFT
jgi:hypothetical protein